MSYSSIFKYRNIWMGIAIIWVFLYHMCDFVHIPILSDIISIGYAGCDIFLFASGVGIYYSLDKNDDLFSYLKKRIIRLMPLYWVILLIWILFRFYIGQMTWQAVIGSVLGIQYFIDWNYDYNWYIPVMLLCYIIAPFLKKLLDKITGIAFKIILLIILICMSFAWSGDVMMMIGMTRIPIFCLGMMFGQPGRSGKVITRATKIIWFILIPIGIGVTYYASTYMGWNGWKSGLNWLPMLIATPGLCMLISLIAEKLEANRAGKAINSFFKVIGNHSLEIYFAHVTVVLIFRDYMIKSDSRYDTPFNWMLAIVISIAGTFVIYGIQRLINRIFDGRRVRE